MANKGAIAIGIGAALGLAGLGIYFATRSAEAAPGPGPGPGGYTPKFKVGDTFTRIGGGSATLRITGYTPGVAPSYGIYSFVSVSDPTGPVGTLTVNYIDQYYTKV